MKDDFYHPHDNDFFCIRETQQEGEHQGMPKGNAENHEARH